MTTLLLTLILATPACPAGQMLIGKDAAGKAKCGTWQQLQAKSRTGAGAVIRVPKGAVKRPTANTYVMPRAVVADLLGQGLGRLAGQARIEPQYVKGKRIGFGVTRIRAGSVLETLGLRNGDLLIDVNGADLGKPAAVLGLYALIFRPNAAATLRLRRKGKPLTLIWRIDG